MIPARARNPAPVPAGPIPQHSAPRHPRPRAAVPAGISAVAPRRPRAIPAVPPQTRPKANDLGTPRPSATPKRFLSSAS
jgi:hypothetical protein